MAQRLSRKLVGISALALLPFTPALAQSGSGLEEIVVTARRVEENIQSVPIAITALTPKVLEQKDIRTAYDLEKSVPGLSLCCFRNNSGFGWIRGVPGVVGYFAEIPTSLSGNATYFDLANVQVLKGPQGTLFGLSTNGGAIVLTPAKPSEKVEGHAQVALGDYGRFQGEAVVNVPIVADKVLLRLGASVTKIDGYIYDPTQKADLANENYKVFRGGLTIRPTETIENYLLVNYYQSDDNNNPLGVASLINPTGATRAIFGAATVDALFAQQLREGKYRIPGISSNGTFSHVKQWNIADHLSWELSDNLTVRNILGYQASKIFQRNDLDALPLPIIDTGVGNSVAPGFAPEWTEELQLQGKAFDNKLTVTAGSFNRWTQNSAAPNYNAIFGGLNGTVTKNKGKTNALYAQGTYDLGAVVEGLSFTAGFRYSWEKRQSNTTNLTGAGIAVAYSADSAKWKSPSYTLSLAYQATDDVLLYVTNSKGFSSGGFNGTAPQPLRVFNPETLSNVEVGIKADWMLGTVPLRTNVSGYYGFYSDIQVPITSIVQTPTGPQLSVVTQNAATGHIEGIDAEATIIPVSGLEIGGNLALLRARYDKYISNGVDLSSTKFVFTPNYKYGINIRYTLPLDPKLGEISVSGDYVKQGEVVATARAQPQIWDMTPPNDNLNVNINWDNILGRDGLSGAIFIYNVTGNQSSPGQLGTYDTLGILGLGVAPPRMWGGRLRYRFG